MEFSGRDKLMQFAENMQIIKKEFIWHNTLTKRLAALLYAQSGKIVDCEAIKECYYLMKENTGVFSTFRGNMALCIAALLSLSPNPHEVFTETLNVYDMLKNVRFRVSDFLVIAAYQIAALSENSRHMEVVTRTRSFYDGMKSHHFFYTGTEDYVFNAMLGLSDLDSDTGVERIERLFSLLKDDFWDKNSVQALAQVLVLGNSDENVVNRVFSLKNALREQKIKLDKTYTLPLLGTLALLTVETEQVVRDIWAAQDMLREQKGFGFLSVSTQELLLYAASIVVGEYANSAKSGVLTATLSTSITNIIIAQQAATIAACAAATAAASSSSSS